MAAAVALGGVVALGATVATGPTQAAHASASPRPVVDPLGPVVEAFGLRTATLTTLDLTGIEPGTPFLLPMSLHGLPAVLDAWPVDVRAEGYELLVAGEDGVTRPVAAGASRTFRGRLLGPDEAIVAGAFTDHGLEAMIRYADGSRFWLEPVAARIDGAPAGQYLFYGDCDVEQVGHRCHADETMRIGPGPDQLSTFVSPEDDDEAGGGGDPVEGGTVYVAELACDADYEYYQDYGSVTAVENRITSIVNTLNAQYEGQTGIRHDLTTIIVRTSSNDPYSSSDAGTLLNQFRNHWNSSQGGVVRDVAHLFTGKEINGGTIGIAWLSAVCSSYAYGLSQSDFNGSYSCATDLTAHELGHNWGADHCSCTSFTMNPYITCANQFSSSQSVPDIVGYRNSILGCLDEDNGDPPPPPAGTDLEITKLTINNGTIVGGSMASLEDSDNSRLQVQSEEISNNRDRTEVRVEFDATGVAGSNIQFRWEVNCSTTNVPLKLYARNWNTSKWVRLVNTRALTTDKVYQTVNLDYDDFVRSSDGLVRLRMVTQKRNRPHVIRYDEVNAFVP